MLEFLKKNIIIIILSSITLFLGFLTFLTFIDRSFVDLNENAKEYLRFLNTQKLIRDVDEIHIIDENKKLLYSTEKKEKYIPVSYTHLTLPTILLV